MVESPIAKTTRAPLIRIGRAPLPARLVTKDRCHDGYLLRQSADGFVIELESYLSLDAKVALALPGTLHSGGRVQWRQGKRHGIAFNENREELKGVLTRWQVAPQPTKDRP